MTMVQCVRLFPIYNLLFRCSLPVFATRNLTESVYSIASTSVDTDAHIPHRGCFSFCPRLRSAFSLPLFDSRIFTRRRRQRPKDRPTPRWEKHSFRHKHTVAGSSSTLPRAQHHPKDRTQKTNRSAHSILLASSWLALSKHQLIRIKRRATALNPNPPRRRPPSSSTNETEQSSMNWISL